MRVPLHFLCISLGLGVAVAASQPARSHADTFVLRSGGEIRGEWLNADDHPVRTYLVKSENGVQLRLNAAQVVQRIRHSDALQEYDRLAPTFADTVAEQKQLADWCHKKGLADQRRRHLQRVVELDPGDAAAWNALGYTERDGRWVTTRGYFEERGFVYYRGKWRLPQEVEVLEELRRIDQLERTWQDQLKSWRTQLEASHDPEIARRISAIDDPMAIRALRHMLSKERNAKVRVLYLTALSRIQDSRAMVLLVAAALDDPDAEVFHECENLILKLQYTGLAKELGKMLKDPHNGRVNRTAHILGRLGDPTVVPALIDALVTTHYIPLPGNMGRTTATMAYPASAPGPAAANATTIPKNAAFVFGSGAAHVPVQVPNQEVLQALVRLSHGQSFGFDRQGWLDWWTLSSRTPSAAPALR